MVDILLIRHGETDWNRQNRWQGWIDPPLNDTGVAQAKAGALALAGLDLKPLDLFASDLERALATAEIIGSALGVDPKPHPAFRERHGGVFEGLDRAEIESRHPGALDAWHEGRIAAPPGGESDDEVRERFTAGLREVVAATDRPATILVVTHGGAMRILARGPHGTARSIPNLGGHWFAWDRGRLSVGSALDPPDVSLPAPDQRNT